MGSTRLPGKVLRDLSGQPMLARVVERLGRASTLDEVWVATSTLAADDPIVALCAARGWPCFRGSESDVLERYFQTAQAAGADAIVRVTADCPLIDPGVVDEVVRAFLARQPGLDYACNFHPRRTFPRGLDAEILSRQALAICRREATDPATREHVTLYLYQHPERFQIQGIEAAGGDWSGLRWTVDTPEDFALATAIYEHFGHDRFSWREALAAVEAHPEWSALNRHIEQKKP
jgi:spore coat polysaccharide biosynthesis protein SpsF